MSLRFLDSHPISFPRPLYAFSSCSLNILITTDRAVCLEPVGGNGKRPVAYRSSEFRTENLFTRNSRADQKEIFRVRESVVGMLVDVVVVEPPTSLPRSDCRYFLKPAEKPPLQFDPCRFLSPGSFSCQVSSYRTTTNSVLLGE